jgi:two-component system CheB/CheR fusion protein
VFATFEDITEMKEKESQMVRTLKLFYQLLENSPVGKLVVTKNGRISYANKHAEEIFAMPAAEIELRFYNNPDWKITDLNGNEIPDELLPFRLISEGKNQMENYRLKIENGAGKRICLSINGSPMFDESGNVDGVVFSLEELTTE